MREPSRATVTVDDRIVRKVDPLAELLELLAQMFLAGAGVSGPDTGERFDAAAVAWASAHGAELITELDQGTEDRAREILDSSLRENLTAHEFQERLQNDKSGLFGRDRALMIARTETAIAFNVGESERWEADGVNQVRIIDGDLPETDLPCKTANGQIWTIEEYRLHPIAHPNCQRSAIPVDRFDEVPPSMLGHSIDSN